MKYIISLAFLWYMGIQKVLPQTSLHGQVVNAEGEPLVSASVRLMTTGPVTTTNTDGHFFLPFPNKADTLVVSYVGYLQKKILVTREKGNLGEITLLSDPNAIQEVIVNTGYYQVPQERATGAFTHIDNALLNRSVGANILDRLEGITNSLLFDRRNLSGEDVNGEPELRVRGVSTIEADGRPLIVVDNFPYEGDISTINPNDVESITVLRDAAAASIWGARAGNGVIVINMKQGRYNMPTEVTFNTNMSFGEKPDLFYSQNYLPAGTVMDIQKELFERGAYQERNQTRIPTYVELLIKKRDGKIGEDEFLKIEERMRQTDLRAQATDYLYQPLFYQQYMFGASGGGNAYRYALSVGYDRNRSNLIGDDNSRLNLSLQNSFKVRDNLEFSGSLWYTKQNHTQNGISYTNVSNSADIYEQIMNSDGTPAYLGRGNRLAYQEQAETDGLLDWLFRPLEEVRLIDDKTKNNELRLNGNVNYRIWADLNLSAGYQYVLGNGQNQTTYDKDSYFVRNLVNRFTQTDGERIIPHGGIVNYGLSFENTSHSGRVLLNFNRELHAQNYIAILAGAEVRQDIRIQTPGVRLYDYNTDTWLANARYDYQTRFPTRPTGSSQIPLTSSWPEKMSNRFLSYFGNASYTHRERYILTGSLRWDASNLLGVKTNRRGTALWSIGGSWDLNKEAFYDLTWLPYLRLRATYGSAGNIDKTQSHFPTITTTINQVTGLPQSNLTHPGNPSLRWEQVNTLNLGVDWRIFNNRITGSIEYYNKHAKHLLGDNRMDPTTGVLPNSLFKVNYANLRTQGWDVQLKARLLSAPLSWQTVFLFNYSTNIITKLDAPNQLYALDYVNSQIPQKGKSIDLLYALPWYGLNQENGMPIIFYDGEKTTEVGLYQHYLLNLKNADLIEAGNTVPSMFGSVRNTFEWRRFSLDILLSYKGDYVFRATSIGPGDEYNSLPHYHTDLLRRWKYSGDERNTNVPAHSSTSNMARSQFYRQSEVLIENGAHIRLKDISLSYSLLSPISGIKWMKKASIYSNVKNLGVIWKASRNVTDPEYTGALYPMPRIYAFGVQIDF